jgi:hypothetical protein
MCNFEDQFAPTPDDVRRKLATLRDHCAAVGPSPFEEIEGSENIGFSDL